MKNRLNDTQEEYQDIDQRDAIIADLERELAEARESLKELVQAMHDYQMDVDDPPPYKHVAMMERAYTALREQGGEVKP
jgi:uncharacterized protein (DUF3084 family)